MFYMRLSGLIFLIVFFVPEESQDLPEYLAEIEELQV